MPAFQSAVTGSREQISSSTQPPHVRVTGLAPPPPYALIAALSFAFLFSTAGLQAQDASSSALATAETLASTSNSDSPSPTPSETERVIITGSNIPTANEVGPNPVQVITRDYIEQSGERAGEDFLRDLPIANANGVPSSNNNTSNTPGASAISLRGFDPSETLVLIDGRRVAPYPLGANGYKTFVDLNSIPKAAISSIEILKDSASSTYGADAVAGVVNIKFLHDYNGAQADIEYGNTLDRDSGEFAASLIFGIGNSNTNVSGVLNYYHRNSIFTRDRGYSQRPPLALLSTSSSPFNLQLSRTAVIAAGGTPPNATSRNFFGHSPFLSNGLAPASDYTYTTFRSSLYNFDETDGALPDSERYGGFLNADHKVFGDQLVAYGDFFYQNVWTHNELAPTPTGVFEQPGKTVLAIPPHAPGPTLGGPTYAETGLPMGAYNPFNPFQQIISGSSRGRLAEFGNRLEDNETDAYLATLGIKGDKLLDGSWGYDSAARYSEIDNTSSGRFVSATRFNRILNAADPIFDPASPQFIGTTVPYNPFGDYRRPIPANQAPITFATVYPVDTDISRLITVDLNVYTTELLQLPAGGVGFAIGGQFRHESIDQRPDLLFREGDVLGFTSQAIFTSASKESYGLYSEASIPVFSSTFSLPGFHALDFSAAVRFEEFLSNGNNVMVPKVGMRWQPLDESFTIRSTWGEGFREPSLIELYTNPRTFLYTDNNLFEVPVTTKSNPNLQPEDSRAFTAGIVYTPKFVPGLSATIDVWDIESKGRVISFLDPNGVVARANAGSSLFGESVTRDANGEIIAIEEAFQNGGSQKARGIDFGLLYQLATRFGTVTSITQATMLDSFQYAELPGQKEQELRSSAPFNAFDPYLKWKGVSRLGWSWQHLDALITAHYLDGYHEFGLVSGEHYVKQTWFFDVQASYEFRFSTTEQDTAVGGYSKDGKPSDVLGTINYSRPLWQQALDRTRLTIGCNDVFGQDPPRSVFGFPQVIYDETGRFVYLKLTKRF